jgi:hypothetical protein
MWSGFPRIVNVTRALRPSAEISALPPGPNGDLTPCAVPGRARRTAAICRVACRSCGSDAIVRPGSRAWISTLSAGGEITLSRCRTCSPCPDWPTSYDGTLLAGSICPPTKTAATRAVGQHEPDAVVVDVRMPPTFTDEGLRAALVVRGRWPGVGVLVLSQYVEERYATELLWPWPARSATEST